MAISPLNSALRAERRAREATRDADALSVRMQALAVAGIRDYAETHGIPYRVARERLRTAAHHGRTRDGEPGDG